MPGDYMSYPKNLRESLSHANMSSFLIKENAGVLREQGENKPEEYMRIIKSLSSLSKALETAGMTNTSTLVKTANSLMSKQLGLLKSKKPDDRKEFALMYGALLQFFIALDNMMDGIDASMEASDADDNSTLNDTLKGGVSKYVDSFIPSKSSELFPKLKKWYADIESLGTNESISHDDKKIDEGPVNAIVGLVKKMLGSKTVPTSSKATASNLAPLFKGGNILKALQTDLESMTVGDFRTLRKTVQSSTKIAIGSSASTSNPITTPLVDKDEETFKSDTPTGKAAAPPGENKTVPPDSKKSSDKSGKLDKSKDTGEDVPAAKPSGTTSKESSSGKISIKKLISDLGEDEKSDLPKESDLSVLPSAFQDEVLGVDLNPQLEKELGKGLSKALTKAIRDIVKDKVVERKESQDDVIIERWAKLAGLIN
jgi:hypothetical protein